VSDLCLPAGNTKGRLLWFVLKRVLWAERRYWHARTCPSRLDRIIHIKAE
jgi:hypothetical protein